MVLSRNKGLDNGSYLKSDSIMHTVLHSLRLQLLSSLFIFLQRILFVFVYPDGHEISDYSAGIMCDSYVHI